MENWETVFVKFGVTLNSLNSTNFGKLLAWVVVRDATKCVAPTELMVVKIKLVNDQQDDQKKNDLNSFKG